MSTGPVDNVTSIKPFATRAVEHVLVVHFRNLRWEVAHNGVTRPMIDWLFSRERAVEHAFELAEELRRPGKTRVMVRVEDGDDSFEELLEALPPPAPTVRPRYSAAMGSRRLR